MNAQTSKYIINEFERQRLLIHRKIRLITDIKIIENLALGLNLQKSKIIEILKVQGKFKDLNLLQVE